MKLYMHFFSFHESKEKLCLILLERTVKEQQTKSDYDVALFYGTITGSVTPEKVARAFAEGNIQNVLIDLSALLLLD